MSEYGSTAPRSPKPSSKLYEVSATTGAQDGGAETTGSAVEGSPPVHLIAADGAISERYQGKLYFFSQCGKVLEETQLPHASCMEEECGCEIWYCQECIRAAVEWNAEVGVPSA